MPAELVRRVNLDLIHPDFLERVLDGLAEAMKRGHAYFATLGFRTFAEQDTLYAQGRTAPGNVVTNARGGESAHCFGLALDFCHDADLATPGLQMDWQAPHYACLGEVMRARGLVWGGTWGTHPDRPHVQVPGFVHAVELAPLLPFLADHTEPLERRLRNAWNRVALPALAM